MKKRRKSGLLYVFTAFLFMLAVYMLVTQCILPYFFQKRAEEKVQNLVEQAGIDTFSYSAATEASDEVYFAVKLYALADWEKKQKELIRKTLDTDEEPRRLPGGPFAPPTPEYFLWQAKLVEKPISEKALKEEVNRAINDLYERSGEYAPVRKTALLAYYKWSGFDVLCQTLELIRGMEGQSSYNPALFELFADTVRYGLSDRCVPADLLYTFWPYGFRQCCTAKLVELVQNEDYDGLAETMKSVDAFEKRYQTSVELSDYIREIKNSWDRKKEAERIKKANEEFRAKPDIPTVGMSYEKARSTKLGTPTRTNKTEYYSSAAKKTYYNGNMYWDQNGKQIFRAEFKNSVITNVWDTRYSNYGSGKSNYYGSGSGKKNKGTNKKDAYDVYDYDDPDDFADEWAGEFGDGDYDGGWEDAWDYWQDNH